MSDSRKKAREIQGAESDFPTAGVVDKPAEVFGLTRLWWLAAGCLLLAVELVVWSLPAKGMKVRIAFPEGHGLRAQDAVRFRGIDVGAVESVRLNPTLEHVEVDVRLLPSAEKVAVEGSRFWIVRPQVSITGVSGLETAVGHKYIEVLPGPGTALKKRTFDGLAQPPADSASEGGIEILLRADTRHSVSAGSTIHYRGVDVGRILSVGLSADARHVEVRGKVFQTYAALVNTQSRFWATGGVDVDFSLREGITLETESLDTLARGGVSMLVIGNGDPVEPGHVFPLAASAEQEWLSKANQLLMTSVELRGAVVFEATWKQKVLFRDWKKSRRFTGIALADQRGNRQFVVPADVLQWQREAVEGTFAIGVFGANGRKFETAPATDVSGDAVLLPLVVPDGLDLPQEQWLTPVTDSLRLPGKSLAVRQTLEDGMYVHLPIERANVNVVSGETGTYWQLQNFSGDRAVWHGCPVLNSTSGELVGILLIAPSGPRVWPVVN